MKLDALQAEHLVNRIQQARVRLGLSVSEISKLADVEHSHTWRILRGHIRTVSGNVMKICAVLGIDPLAEQNLADPDAADLKAAWMVLEASVRNAWDKTPEGAIRLSRLINALPKD